MYVMVSEKGPLRTNATITKNLGFIFGLQMAPK